MSDNRYCSFIPKRSGHGNKYNNRNVKKNRRGKLKLDLSSIVTEHCLNEDVNTDKTSKLNIAVEGCCHGELDTIYSLLEEYEVKNKVKIDLLICCGDFESLRNATDLESINVPDKFKGMGDFYQYYSSKKVAPILTIFVGGNHENSFQLQDLFYGGWVAPNIYYLGHANCIRFAGLRIASLSGIYNGHTYYKKRYEFPPYNSSSIRSVYHIRNDAIHRLSSLSEPIDIMITHDWPRGIEQFGNISQLIRCKPFFRQEIQQNRLGNPLTESLLNILKPKWWLSAHLHVQYEAKYIHGNNQVTKFRALDKVLPKRKFLRILTLPTSDTTHKALEYDFEWLAIIRKTHHLLSSASFKNILKPFQVSNDEIGEIKTRFQNKSEIPKLFTKTAPPYDETLQHARYSILRYGDPQTDAFLNLLQLNHVVTIPYQLCKDQQNQILPMNQILSHHTNHDENTINLDEDKQKYQKNYTSSFHKNDGNEIILDEELFNHENATTLDNDVKKHIKDENDINLDDL